MLYIFNIMTDFTFEHDGQFAIFGKPQIDEKMTPLMMLLSKLVFILQGRNDIFSHRSVFNITWTVENKQPRIAKIVGAYDKYNDVQAYFEINFDKKISLQVVDAEEAKSDTKDAFYKTRCFHMKDGVLVYEVQREYYIQKNVKKIDEIQVMTNILTNILQILGTSKLYDMNNTKIAIHIRKPDEMDTWSIIPDLVRKTSMLLFDLAWNGKLDDVSWHYYHHITDGVCWLSLSTIQTKKCTINYDYNSMTFILSDKQFSFGLSGYNRIEGQEFLKKSYNHVEYFTNDTNSSLWKRDCEPSNKQITDLCKLATSVFFRKK